MTGNLSDKSSFLKEGWSLAEFSNVCRVVAAPYVVPSIDHSSFEHLFKEELPLLHEYLQEATVNKDPVTGLPMWHDL
ncbi:hypothetical protein LguiA_027098 [Lonicera macranthoides]